MLNRIMAANPWIEVAIRTAYWRSPFVHALLTRLQRRARSTGESMAADALPRLIERLRDLGVAAGDILIVHSDLNLLRRLGVRPAEVNAALLELLGSTGTLVMPAYPCSPTNRRDGIGSMLT